MTGIISFAIFAACVYLGYKYLVKPMLAPTPDSPAIPAPAPDGQNAVGLTSREKALTASAGGPFLLT